MNNIGQESNRGEGRSTAVGWGSVGAVGAEQTLGTGRPGGTQGRGRGGATQWLQQARGAGCRRPARTPVWSCGKWRDGAAKDRSGDTEGQRAGCRRPAGGGQGWAMGEMGNRPGRGGDFGRAKRRP